MNPISLQDANVAATQGQAPVLVNEADDPKYRAKAKDAAEKFEAFFIASMVKQMRNVTRELADEESVYKKPVNQDMLELADGKLADTMAGQHAFGIADAILRQLLPAPAPVSLSGKAESAPAPLRKN
jgi:flagellar protein FlgJ